MWKRVMGSVLAAALLAGCCGCAAMLETETYSETQHQSTVIDVTENTPDAEIRTKRDINRALQQAISEHATQYLLRFPKTYSGDAEGDIYEVSMDICNNTSLGAYAVYYISSNINHYPAYYEAEISITYKKTAEQVNSIVSVLTMDTARELIRSVLNGSGSSLVIQTPISTLTAEFVTGYVTELYYSDPGLTAVLPKTDVEVYTDDGQGKILDIQFTYPESQPIMLRKQGDINNMVQQLTGQLISDNDASKTLEAAIRLSNLVEYDTEMSGVSENSYDLWNSKFTAYGALMEGIAASEGIAMAYKMICDEIGVNCQVVVGRHGEDIHAWNIIQIDDAYYHMDVAAFDISEGSDSLFLRDSDVIGSYGWDTGKYPQCEGYLTYDQVAFMTNLSGIISPFTD